MKFAILLNNYLEAIIKDLSQSTAKAKQLHNPCIQSTASWVRDAYFPDWVWSPKTNTAPYDVLSNHLPLPGTTLLLASPFPLPNTTHTITE